MNGRTAAPITAFLGVLLPLILLLEARPSYPDLLVLFAWGLAFYSSLRLGMTVEAGQQRLLSMTFWIFVYVFLAMPAVVQLSVHDCAFPSRYRESTMLSALAVIAFGVIVYELGYSTAQRHRWHWRTVDALEDRAVSLPRLYLLSVVAVIVSAALVVYLGGLFMVLQPREQLNETVKSTAGGGGGLANSLILHQLLQVPPWIALYLGWAVFMDDWRSRRRRRLALLLSIFIAGVTSMIVCNPINGGRYWFGTLGLACAFATFRWRGRRSLIRWSVGLTMAMLFAFPVLAMLRTGESISLEMGTDAIVKQLATSDDFDTYHQVVMATDYVEHQGFTGGYQLLGAMLSWIPRAVWANKPIQTGSMLAEYSGYSLTNLSCPLWAEAYIDFGPIELALMFFGYGALTSIIEAAYLRRRRHGVQLISVLVWFLAGYQFYILRGSLLNAFGYLVPALGLIVLIFRVRTRVGREEARQIRMQAA